MHLPSTSRYSCFDHVFFPFFLMSSIKFNTLMQCWGNAVQRWSSLTLWLKHGDAFAEQSVAVRPPDSSMTVRPRGCRKNNNQEDCDRSSICRYVLGSGLNLAALAVWRSVSVELGGANGFCSSESDQEALTCYSHQITQTKKNQQHLRDQHLFINTERWQRQFVRIWATTRVQSPF